MFDFGAEVQQVNSEWAAMLSQDEQVIAARMSDEDDGRWQHEDMVQREGGCVSLIKRLLKDGSISDEEASLLAWAANVSIKP